MTGLTYPQIKIKKSDKIVTFDRLLENVTDKKVFDVDSNSLFNRFLALINKESDIKKYFCYELTPYPLSIFINGFMRPSQKRKLKDELLKNVELTDMFLKENYFIIDGGWLIYKVRWGQVENFGDIGKAYFEFLKSNYGDNFVVVFDGYDHGTKDHEHLKRYKKKNCDFVFNSSTSVLINQDDCLASIRGKMKIIEYLVSFLSKEKIKVVHVIKCSCIKSDCFILFHCLTLPKP